MLALIAGSVMLIPVLTIAGAAQAQTPSAPSAPSAPASYPPASATPGAQFGTELASPATTTGPNCTYGSSSGNVYTCVTVSHSGTYIDYVYGSGAVVDSTRTLDECIYYGGSTNYLACSGYIRTSPGTAVYVYWSPYANEPSGYYCTSTWRANNSGPATLIGWDCAYIS
jgi:hypothetical protein